MTTLDTIALITIIANFALIAANLAINRRVRRLLREAQLINNEAHDANARAQNLLAKARKAYGSNRIH